MRTHFRDYRQSMKKQKARGGNQATTNQPEVSVDDPEESEETSSWMTDHMMEKHKGKISENPQQDFEFHTLAAYSKVLNRLVAESVWIETAESKGVLKVGPVLTKIFKQLLNRKGEFYHFNPRGRQPGPS